MPRRLGEKYFHRQLLEDFGVAYACHEMVIHHEDEDICNNSIENLSFVTRQMQAFLKRSEGEAPFDLQTFILPPPGPQTLQVALNGASEGGISEPAYPMHSPLSYNHSPCLAVRAFSSDRTTAIVVGP